jgi:hypothetical protein
VNTGTHQPVKGLVTSLDGGMSSASVRMP